MPNKIYVALQFTYSENKSGYGSVKSTIKVSAKKKNSDSIVDVKLKPLKTLDFDKFQYLVLKYGNAKEKDGLITISFNHVQARLYKGINNYGPFKLLKVFLCEHIILSCFLDKTQESMLNDFMELNAEYSENTKEMVEFEEPITI